MTGLDEAVVVVGPDTCIAARVVPVDVLRCSWWGDGSWLGRGVLL